MRKAKTNKTYTVLSFDEEGGLLDGDADNEIGDIDVKQYRGETLEVWKERQDGFLFVYCNRLEIGYWVLSDHITMSNISSNN
jgi:hypothetical protein